jgi:D-arabinitol dehydrogenase (NADP+)
MKQIIIETPKVVTFIEVPTPTVAALQSGRIKTEGLISHRFSLEEYGKALETLRSDKSAHKVVIEF